MFEKNARNRLMHEYIAVVYPEIGCLERLPCSSGSSGGGRKYCRVAGMGWNGCVLRVLTTHLLWESRQLRTQKRRNYKRWEGAVPTNGLDKAMWAAISFAMLFIPDIDWSLWVVWQGVRMHGFVPPLPPILLWHSGKLSTEEITLLSEQSLNLILLFDRNIPIHHIWSCPNHRLPNFYI